MIKNDLLKVINRKGKGKSYIVKINYERFTQINFPEKKASLVVISNFKNYELSNSNKSTTITGDLGNGNYVKDEILVDSLEFGGAVVSKIESGNTIIVIKEKLSKEIIIDNLMVLEDRKTAMEVLSVFGSLECIELDFEFPRDNMKEAVKLIQTNGENIVNVDLQTVRHNIDNGTVNLVSLIMKVVYSYDIKKELIPEGTTKLIKNSMYGQFGNSEDALYAKSINNIIPDPKIYVGKDYDMIPDAVEGELMNVLDEQAKDVEEENTHSGYNVRPEEYDYEGAYYELCDMLNSNHPIDGIIDISMNPKYRDAILEKNFQLDKKKK